MPRNSNILKYIFLIVFIIVNLIILIKIWPLSRQVKQTEIIDLDVVRFNMYMLQFNKTYSALEYKRRLRNFRASLIEIARMNALEGNKVFGLTKFSDMSAQEFAQKMLMKRVESKCFTQEEECDRRTYMKNKSFSSSMGQYWDDLPIPDRVDWRERGYVSPVQDQKKCQGCWAFAVIGVMETMAAKHNIAREPLSVQEVLECSHYNEGCVGGNVRLAMDFICYCKLGIFSADKYPLTLKNSTCNGLLGSAVTIKRFRYHCNMEEDNILRLIAHHGPVTAIVNAVPWVNYIGGIIHRACVQNDNRFHHAVSIVGYDKRGAIPYYIVKNSWGPIFGDHGYVKVKIYGNICGIAEEIGELDVKRKMMNVHDWKCK